MDAPAVPHYRRLPGRTPWLRFGGVSAPSSSLWLGLDHVLKVDRSSSRETYKRFYYRDIQAIVVEESSRRFTLTVFSLPVIAIIAVLTLAFSSSAISGLPAALFFASPVIVGLVVNLALGRTSQGRLVTAVGTEHLPSLGRMQRASQALQQIGDEVIKVQGALGAEQLISNWPVAIATPPKD